MYRFFPVLCLFALVYGATPLFAQNPAHRAGEILFSPDIKTDALSLAHRLDENARVEKVSGLLNVWLMYTSLPEQEVLHAMSRYPEIRFAQLNHYLENRAATQILPDDPLLSQQWHLLNEGQNGGVFDADIDAELAWNISSGGLTPAGDTVVLAVIDGGLQAGLAELNSNIRRNWEEIPNNGLDDDNNGYVDDFWGWNVFTQNDHIQGNNTEHGTPISAIIGARGNNGQGITGVNWNVKIMFVSATGTESAILAAYDYVWQARRRYNATLGNKGAFVVAVNCSWGINYGQPDESPVWCAAFDSLGAAGIVSVAATANIPVNVDEVGDLPTTCPSNYLISVTGLDRFDARVESAAWGAQHIDLGAFGKEIYSLGSNGAYNTYNGTSFAAPQVTGLIGLLYAAPCPNLIAMAKTSPAEAAYWAKSLVMENTTPNLSLNGLTATSGRLNLFNTLRTYQNQCSDCPPPFALKTELLEQTSALLLWTNGPGNLGVNLRWRVLGMGNWNEFSGVSDSFLLQGLIPCTSYEFEMQSVCDKGVESPWSAPFIFKTVGCCTTPALIWVQNSTENSALIAWGVSSYDNTYRAGLRLAGSGNWVFYESSTNSFTFNGLAPCTLYEFKVQSRCDEWVTPFSSTLYFTTKGCGACNEINYCAAGANDASEEWISWLQIGEWSNVSGPGGNGFQNFSNNQTDLPVFLAGTTLPVAIAPGFSGTANKEYFRIFVDYNQDGDFLDSFELAFDPGFALEGIATGAIEVPAFVTPGITRMRVIMKFTTANDLPPAPCGAFPFGQVEDYCATLKQHLVNAPVTPEISDGNWRLYPQPAGDWVLLELPQELTERNTLVTITDMAGRIVLQDMATSTQWRLDTKHWSPGVYAVQIRTSWSLLHGKIMKL
jgi:hypothetical protein